MIWSTELKALAKSRKAAIAIAGLLLSKLYICSFKSFKAPLVSLFLMKPNCLLKITHKF